jgi:hypothetical protein
MEPGKPLTEAEKNAECQRICGDSGKQGLHRSVPMCPILQDIWHGVRKKRERAD